MNLKFSADPAKQANAVILYPAFLSTGILVLLSFPITSIISLIYPLCTPLFVLSTYFRIVKDKSSLQLKENELNKSQWIGAVVMFLTLITIDRIFASGINL
jgi:hypothetical protein